MTAKVIKNLPASIRARLLQYAKQHGETYNRILTRYAIERLLFRLAQTESAEKYVLKGAMLFVTWPEHAFRPTGDLDLLGHGDPAPAALIRLFGEICQVEFPGDGILFDSATLKAEPVREADRYQGVRLSLQAGLGGAIVDVQIDIGFGDHVYPPPRRQQFPSLLEGIPPAMILMYPPETVVAEKFEAIIRFGVTNTRLKDFYDIWVTTRTFRFDLPSLLGAVNGTLDRRGTATPQETPIALTGPFATIVDKNGLWTGFLRRTPPTLAPPSFVDLQDELRTFFGPVIAGLGQLEATSGEWDPSGRAWR